MRTSLRIASFVIAAAGLMAPAMPVSASTVDVSADSIEYHITATTLTQHCITRLHDAEEAFNHILAHSVHGATFSSVVLPLEDTEANVNDALVADELLGSVSSDRAIRDASDQCQSEADHMFSRVTSRPELSTLLHSVGQNHTAKTPADRKLLELWTASVDRTGATLPSLQHQEYLMLSRRLDDLQSAFVANLSNSDPSVTLTAAQTSGLPADFLHSAVMNGRDSYTFVVDESTFERFMRNARDESAREAFYRVYENRGYPENEPILREALSIRLRLAHLLGYPDWASYILADRMAQTPQRVHLFLDGLDEALLPTAQRQATQLAQLKAADLHVAHATLNPWDVLYYNEQLRRTTFAVDSDAVRRYFPAEHVIPAILAVYAQMLGITFTPVVPVHAWSDDVQQFSVADARDHRFIGTLYLDLYPRPGKYTHFASFPLLPVRLRNDGSIRPPINAIIGNWSKPAPGEPATLTHEEVETFFHEFGHAMAALLATAPYETLTEGFRTDFVEAPSQMLENFVWTPMILKKLSKNISDGSSLPDELIAKIIAARHVDDALFNTQQILYADSDLAFHSGSVIADPSLRWHQIARLTTPLVPADFAHPEASFAHIMAGYDAGYYGYLWSRVYAQDMFTVFEADGVESPVVGARYRKTILEPARTIEPDAEVQAFLGRPANPQAFYHDLGITGAFSPLP